VVYLGAQIGYGLTGGRDGYVYAFDAKAGTRIWAFRTSGIIGCNVAVAYGLVFIGSQNATLYAINAATGRQVWQLSTDSFVVGVSAAYGVVYAESSNSIVYAVNPRTGTVIWTAGGGAGGQPAVANGVVFVTNADGANVSALRADTGALLWSTQLDNWIHTPVAVANGIVYTGDQSPYTAFYALSASDGSVLWSQGPNDGSLGMVNPPIVVNGMVYFQTQGGTLIAFGLP
jgi:outer membrane protein assembly factor BamB